MKFNYPLFAVFSMLFLVNFSSAWVFCLDVQNPEVPGNFVVKSNIGLSWSEAEDSPEVSDSCDYGIDYYNVYINGEFLGRSYGLSYSGDPLRDGVIYTFEVSAVDKAGNEGDRAIMVTVFPLSSPDVVSEKISAYEEVNSAEVVDVRRALG